MKLRIRRIRFTFAISSLCLTVLLVGNIETGSCSEGFHSGAAGSCNGCHSMHSANSASQRLLLSSDPSSICLNCHAGLGGLNSPSVFSPDGSALTPGGDFYWLTRSFSWLDGTSTGDSHGHNVVAADFNLFSDAVLTQAPGGTYPSINLACTSCHDPHGQVSGGTGLNSLPVFGSGSYADTPDTGTISGNYRLLGDSHYQPTGGSTFPNDAPLARQSSISKFQESDRSHVDYGSGMSEWCGNCHQEMLNGSGMDGGGMGGGGMGGGMSHHRAGNTAWLPPRIVNNYNTYLRTGDYSGIAATAYLQFVPFERGTTDVLSLDPNSSQGPDTNSNVMCLSCHRAHASAFSNIGRWDFTASLLVDSHPATGDVGATASDVYYRYYGRDFATEFGDGQGQFCEKCHGTSTH